MEDKNFARDLRRLYWVMRLGIACIWGWTAITSWFFYPHAISLEWLQLLGFTWHTQWVLAAACLLDLGMGIASCVRPSRRLWQLQSAIIVFYSIAIALWLPEFLFHPFGAISKNIAVLACLSYLILFEQRSDLITSKR